LSLLRGDDVAISAGELPAGTGSVRRVWIDGTVATIASGAWQPRGIASDGKRAFVSARRDGRVLVFRI
jgi:hypothetical protein